MLWVFGGDLFVGAPREGYGLWRTDDRGDHWVDAYHNMERNDYGARFGTLAFAGDLLSPAVRYVITKWNLYRSWNRGTTWEWLVYPEGNWDHYYNGTLMVSPHTGWVYVGARSGHVFRSRKSGDDWEDVSEGLPQPLEVVCLTADPVERGTVYLGTDQGAYWSRDGGETWSAMPGMQGGRVTALAALGGEPRHLLMVTPEGSTGGAVYRACLRAATGTAVGPEAGDARPLATALHLSYPNPFNARTVISYDLARDGVTHLSIYGTTGQLVRRLVHGPETSGSHSVVWDGLDEAGRPSASGVYFCRLLVGGQGQVGRMVLVR